jgi:hypothetical protein
MTRLVLITAAVLLGVIARAPLANAAVPLDGSVPIVCASTEVRECEVGRDCLRVTPDDINLPHLIRVDAKQKMLTGLGVEQRTAPIHNLERRDGRLVMYGGQEGRGWTVIVEASGRMSATVVDDRVSVIMFGACAAP